MSRAHISFTNYLTLTKHPTYTPNSGKLKIVTGGKTRSTIILDAYGRDKFQCQRQDDVHCEVKFEDFKWEGKLSELKEILQNQSVTKIKFF